MSAPEPSPAPAPVPMPSPRAIGAHSGRYAPSAMNTKPATDRSSASGSGLPSPRMMERPPLSPRVSGAAGALATPAARAAAEREKAAQAAREKKRDAETTETTEEPKSVSVPVTHASPVTETVTVSSATTTPLVSPRSSASGSVALSAEERKLHVQRRTQMELETMRRQRLEGEEATARTALEAKWTSKVREQKHSTTTSEKRTDQRSEEAPAAAATTTAETDVLANARALLEERTSRSRSRSPSTGNAASGVAPTAAATVVAKPIAATSEVSNAKPDAASAKAPEEPKKATSSTNMKEKPSSTPASAQPSPRKASLLDAIKAKKAAAAAAATAVAGGDSACASEAATPAEGSCTHTPAKSVEKTGATSTPLSARRKLADILDTSTDKDNGKDASVMSTEKKEEKSDASAARTTSRPPVSTPSTARNSTNLTNGSAGPLLSQKEADQMLAAAQKEHKQSLKEKDNEIKQTKKDLESSVKEVAKLTAKLSDTQSKLEAEKAAHTSTKTETKEKQQTLTKELKQAQKDTKEAVGREQKLQKEVEKLTASLEAAKAKASTVTAPTTKHASTSLNGSFSSAAANTSLDTTAAEEMQRTLATLSKEKAALEKELARVSQNANLAEAKRKETEEASKVLEKELSQFKKDLAEAHKQLSEKQKETEEAEAEITKQRAALEALRKESGILTEHADPNGSVSKSASPSRSRSPRQVTFHLPGEGTTPASPTASSETVTALRNDLAAAEKKLLAADTTKVLLERKNDTLQKLVEKLEDQVKKASEDAARASTSTSMQEQEVKQLQRSLQESEQSANKLYTERENLREELREARATIEESESEINELNEKLILTESELSDAKSSLAKLQTQVRQQEQGSKSEEKSDFPEKESKVRMMLDQLTKQEAAFAKERADYVHRIRELEDAVCELQTYADEQANEARMLAQSLEETEMAKEHVLSTWSAKAADLQAELARVQAQRERENEDYTTSSRGVNAEAETAMESLKEELADKTAAVARLEDALAVAKQELKDRTTAAASGSKSLEHKVKELETKVRILQAENLQHRTTNEQLAKKLNATEKQEAEVKATPSHEESMIEQLQQEREARERLEAEVAALKESLQLGQQQEQQPLSMPRSPVSMIPTSASVASLGLGVCVPHPLQPVTFFSLPDNAAPMAAGPRRPSRARSPQAPHRLDTSCFDPTTGTPKRHEENDANKENRNVTASPLPAAMNGDTATSGNDKGACTATTPFQRKLQLQQQELRRSPSSQMPLPTNRFLNLEDVNATGSRGRGASAGGSERFVSLSQCPNGVNAEAVGRATPAESLAGLSVGPGTSLSAAQSGHTVSVAGAQPLPPLYAAAPASPSGLFFSMSAGRLLVSHHGRRLERLLFQTSHSTGTRMTPAGHSSQRQQQGFSSPFRMGRNRGAGVGQGNESQGGGSNHTTRGADVISTSALASMGHKLHVARSHSSVFAFTIRLLESGGGVALSDGDDPMPRGGHPAKDILVGFSDRFLPMEGFGVGRNSVRYEQCYYLNITTGRIFCPGILADGGSASASPELASQSAEGRRASVARMIDVPYDGWIRAAGKAAAVRCDNAARLHLFLGGGRGDPYLSPSASLSLASTSQARNTTTTAVAAGGSDVCAQPGDEITCCLNVAKGSLSFWWNGIDCGEAVSGLDLSKVSLYPSVEVNQGGVALELL